MEPLLLWLGAPKIVVAGALGGLTRWLTLRETTEDGLISITVGVISARYLHKPIAGFLTWTFRWFDGHAVTAEVSAYVAGLTGVSLAGFMVGFVQAMRRERHGDAD